MMMFLRTWFYLILFSIDTRSLNVSTYVHDFNGHLHQSFSKGGAWDHRYIRIPERRVFSPDSLDLS